jgi:hypothetical protein
LVITISSLILETIPVIFRAHSAMIAVERNSMNSFCDFSINSKAQHRGNRFFVELRFRRMQIPLQFHAANANGSKCELELDEREGEGSKHPLAKLKLIFSVSLERAQFAPAISAAHQR